MDDLHPRDLDSLSKLSALGFEGADVSLSEALGYGLVWKDLGNSYLFVFKRGGTGKWDRKVVRKDVDIKRAWNWAVFDDLASFTGHLDWPKPLDLPEVIMDLLGYYGDYNVFGGPGLLFYVDLDDAPAPDAEWFQVPKRWDFDFLMGRPVWVLYPDGAVEKGEVRDSDEDGFLVSTESGEEVVPSALPHEYKFSYRQVA